MLWELLGMVRGQTLLSSCSHLAETRVTDKAIISKYESIVKVGST